MFPIFFSLLRRVCLLPGVWKVVNLDFSKWVMKGGSFAVTTVFPVQKAPSPVRKVGEKNQQQKPLSEGDGH